MATNCNLRRFVGLVAVLIAVNLDGIFAADGFLFTMPQVLRSGEESEFCMSVYGPAEGSRNISMSMIDRTDPKIRVLVKDVYFNGEQKCNTFTVPSPGEYEMLLYNETAILHDSVEVYVEKVNMVTLVQTDKKVYKPGQTVKFRIVTFNIEQKARNGTVEAIYIKNPAENLVKQYLDVDCDGIVTLEFQLTEEAQLGKWEITVFINESLSSHGDAATSFTVKEYVLPRYEVQIRHPGYILATDEFIDAEVCAFYTYGKPVKGYLDMKMCWTGFQSSHGPCFHQVVEISGCHKVSVNVTELEGPQYSFFGMELNTTASVIEHGTGAMVNATKTGPGVSNQALMITFDDYTKGFFKPNLPYYGKVIVKKPDGTPAPGEKIKLEAIDYKNSLKYTGNFTTDESGIIVYSLCGAFDEKTAEISLRAEAYEYVQETENHNGLYTPYGYQEIRQWFSPSLSFIDIPKTESSYKCGDSLTLSVPFTSRAKTNTDFKYQITARGKIIKSGNVAYKYNITYPGADLLKPPSKICLQREDFLPPSPIPSSFEPIPAEESTIPPPPPFPGIEEPTIPDMLDTDELEESEMELLANAFGPDETSFVGPPDPGMIHDGDYDEPVVLSDILADTVSNFLLDIPIISIMSPKFTLLIYHTMPDGEVVADSMEYEVEPCFDNDVSMTFNASTALPGEKVNLRLEASPGSICGLGIVDKSTQILGGNNKNPAEKIFKAFETLSHGDMPYNEEAYCEERINKLIVEESRESEGRFWHYNSHYVDALQAFQSSGFITLTDLKIETRPCSRTYPIFYDRVPIGIVPDSIPGAMGPLPLKMNGQVTKTKDVKIRTDFPETWLWDLQIVGVNGSEDIEQTAPDTVTSWVGHAICVDAEKGLGISPVESLTTFQPFFVHLQLPYAAVRGERLPLIANVFNYLEKCIYVQLTMEVDERLKVLYSHAIKKPICVCGGNSVTKQLYVTPQDIGSLPVTLKAEVVPGSCDNKLEMDLTYIGLTDAVQRKLFVKAEGVMNEYTHTSYMCPEGHEEKVENLILPLPDNVVKDSERGEVKVIGDIMGPALTNLDNLVRLPTGCGEQNMVGFTPNIFVLKYLSSTNRLTEEIQTNAVKYMEVGYQSELKYRHNDGSYSAFGKNDERGSVWLTAFVVKSFAQAKPYIYIDNMDMEISLTFLRRSQLETGCFRETGKVFSSYMMGGLGRKKSSLTSLTSYVLIALLKAGATSKDKEISGGFNCLNKNFRREKNRMDTYSLALLAYAHTLYNNESRLSTEIMRALNSKAKRQGSLKYWTRDVSKPAKSTVPYYETAPSAEVEMTAYALLAYMEFYGRRAIPHTHETAMWLSQQRNPRGGFSSTQDTVVGLNALSEFALLAYRSEPTSLNVTVEGYKFKSDLEVSDEKKTLLLLQSVSIPTLPSSVSISAQGSGCVLVQANVRFNQLTKNLPRKKTGLQLKIQTRLYQHDIDRCDRKTIRIFVGSRGHHKHSKGMSLLTVKMVTSWAPIPDSLTKILSLSPLLGIKRHEYDEEQGVVTFYLDELRRKPIEINLDVEQDRDMAVSSPKSAEVEVFQYYETDVKIVKSYGLKNICGTKAEIPRKRKEINPLIPVPVEQVRQTRIAGPQRLPVRIITKEPDCPMCVLTSAIKVQNLEELFCNSTSVYKAIAGRGAKKAYSIKLKMDVKATKKQRTVNKFASYTLPKGCNCLLLEPPVSRVHIFASNAMDHKNLFLDAASAVMKSTKALDKLLKRMKKSCP